METRVYGMTEIVGTSTVSWEEAARTAIEQASKKLQDLRISEIFRKDAIIEHGKIIAFRVRIKVSFRYHPYFWLGDTGLHLEKT
jgi:flavin-binding protein dodecin